VIVLGPSAFDVNGASPPAAVGDDRRSRTLRADRISNALAIGYRARSAWFALDLAMSAALGWAVMHTSRTLMDWGAFPFEPGVLSAALWFLAAAVTIAARPGRRGPGRHPPRPPRPLDRGLVAPHAGRARLRRLGSVGRPLRPADFRRVVSAWPSPNGSWLVAAGRTVAAPEHFTPIVLMDASGNGSFALGAGFSARGPVFSEDATRAVWIPDARTDTPR
jgi:hypothetical protein